jgi:hypothetical protein
MKTNKKAILVINKKVISKLQMHVITGGQETNPGQYCYTRLDGCKRSIECGKTKNDRCDFR